jgi:hypothetical protein
MTGQCYYCAAREHHECHSLTCTCCGARNRKEQLQADRLEQQMRRFLAAKLALDK